VRYAEVAIHGSFRIEPEPIDDARGCFARVLDLDELGDRGMETKYVQQSISWNVLRGTLRGLHYQAAPHAEAKMVRCTRGAIYDVILDLRMESPTFRRWLAAELTEDNRHSLYIPAGCAHGFVTLQDATEVHYQISARFDASAARGVRWDDPAFAIEWPIAPVIMSDRDRTYDDYRI
jgi:dTDP-4-dehydrorhamnose 3,5-epimerase